MQASVEEPEPAPSAKPDLESTPSADSDKSPSRILEDRPYEEDAYNDQKYNTIEPPEDLNFMSPVQPTMKQGMKSPSSQILTTNQQYETPQRSSFMFSQMLQPVSTIA